MLCPGLEDGFEHQRMGGSGIQTDSCVLEIRKVYKFPSSIWGKTSPIYLAHVYCLCCVAPFAMKSPDKNNITEKMLESKMAGKWGDHCVPSIKTVPRLELVWACLSPCSDKQRPGCHSRLFLVYLLGAKWSSVSPQRWPGAAHAAMVGVQKFGMFWKTLQPLQSWGKSLAAISYQQPVDPLCWSDESPLQW